MLFLYQELFYKPILNLLVFIINITPGHDLGLAIIILTILIKAILYPLSQKSIKSQKALQDLQPKIEEIKKKYKDNKEEMSKATLELYKENKVNPFSSCLPLLIQLPFLIAFFQVLNKGLANGALDLVYPFVSKPAEISHMFLGLFDLYKPLWFLAILAGAAQFWQAKMLTTQKPAVKADASKDEEFTAILNKQMLYFTPILTIFIGLRLPGGVTLYWLMSTVLTIVQQMLILKRKPDEAPEISGRRSE